MTLGEGIYAYVQTVSAITAILGAGDACQFYPVAVEEQKTPPFAFYQSEVDSAYAAHDGAAGLKSSAVEITAIAATGDAAEALASAFETAFRDFRNGLMGTVKVQGVLWNGSSPSYQWEEQQYASDCKMKIWYVES